MEEGVVTRIKELAQEADKVQTIVIGEKTFTDRAVVPVLEGSVAPLELHTLTAIVEYLMMNADKLDSPIIVISSPFTVWVKSALLGEFNQRQTYLKISIPGEIFRFGQFMNVEQFIIGLQAQFVPSEITAAILKIVGNLTDGVVSTFDDDGVSQKVTARAGVTRKEDIPVPNPVILAPYRTFGEIVQPESRFIFRMKSGEQSPSCALFEADGGAWQIEAINGIKAWFDGKVAPTITILA
jgi:hypothetical protein